MIAINHILSKVDKLVKTYDTRDPFELCKILNIKVHYKNLGTLIKAYYFYQSRISNIVINNQMPEEIYQLLCAHELGHVILHKSIAQARGFFETSLLEECIPTEYEANLFAAELLIPTELLVEYIKENNSFFAIAKNLRIPPELLDFKIRILKYQGYNFKAPFIAKTDFLKNILLYENKNLCD